MERLNLLLDVPGIESDIFDFKGPGKQKRNVVPSLSRHVCAMANTNGGTIVLGIDPVKVPRDGTKILKYEKNGYDVGTEDKVGLDISHQFNNVDPVLAYASKILIEGSKYYIVIEVRPEEIRKPYFVRDSCVCYVRIGSSSEPASRSTVINLFSSLQQRIREVERLRVACTTTSAFLKLNLKILQTADTKSSSTIPSLDLSFLKAAMLESEWFLIDNELLGMPEPGSTSVGMYATIMDLEWMNSLIEGYNNQPHPHDKEKLLLYLNPWRGNENSIQKHLEFLELVEQRCMEFLADKRC